ncbi:type I polyketide synthase [Rugamonas sp. DEMB1]|uniref:type I polyketide synthase n=1 Tax=Rugamonas sp. DEMB1 TaxID=3039386 RepID=UPI00244CF335|nr:type I polyketide synthase [Rugamonas sp. DEMB1]WGG52462.1 SDR family NAD(P)-dependent oxidoreductase [Rugamonas sp. DEMB1]
MNNDIAIIGMAVNLPNIDTLDDFWTLLKSGKDQVDEFPAYRRDEVTKYIRYRKLRALKKVGGERSSFHNGSFLTNVEKMDYRFFNLTPKQACTMDPHHRLILKTLYRAVEDAGYAGNRIAKTDTGVFVGFASNPGQDYSAYLMDIDPSLAQVSLTGNVPCMLANRISHFLDINGPSIIIDSACSASLVATLTAARSVAEGRCSMALVAGARICVPISEASGRIGIESSDGRARTFDEAADGTGLGEGSGAIVLKRLDQALADGDHIYSIIKGGAINHDGATDGITTPDSDSQANLLRAAWVDAGVNPEHISYIEAHGTATRIGDPIEVEGMKRAFASYTEKQQFCAIGTVKSNIGHLFEGSGILGVIKTSLSLYHQTLVPVANYKKTNPLLDLEKSPMYVSNALRPWPVNSPTRLCGVSAFGLGGTNCHVILEGAADPAAAEERPEAAMLFVLSALCPESLTALIKEYHKFATSDMAGKADLADVCFTLGVGRKHLPYRVALIVKNYAELVQSLSEAAMVKTSAAESSNHGDISLVENDVDLEVFKKRYLEGRNVNWKRLFGDKAKTVSVPGYQFADSDCNLYFPDHVSLVAKNFKEDNLLTYQVAYVKKALDTSLLKKTQQKVLLVDCEGSKRCGELRKILEATGNNVSVASLGMEYAQDGQVIVFSHTEEDYRKLAALIKGDGYDHVVHITSGEKTAAHPVELEQLIDAKLMSLFFLTRAIISASFRCKLSVVTENVAYIKGEMDKKDLVPENATLLGMAKVIPRESPFVEVKSYDLDASSSTRSLALEFSSNVPERLVIYRNNSRYIEQFEYIDVESSKFTDVKIRQGGVYLITGGTGAIGLEVARMLSSHANVKIILTSRSGLPERAAWDDIPETSKKLRNSIKTIKEIEAGGSSITVFPVDAGDYEQMKACIEKIVSTSGEISGVIHAAGNAGKNVISMRETKDFEEVIRPKIHGTYFLRELTKGMKLDFMAFFSSVASIYPSAGQGDYAAANTYMDSFCDMGNSEETHMVAMQWTAWRDIGMAVDFDTNLDTTFKAIPTEAGIHCLYQGLRHVPSRTFVGEINYGNEIVVWLDKMGIQLSRDILEKIAASQEENEQSVSRGGVANEESSGDPVLTGRESGSYSDTERAVARVWADSLGYDTFDINAAFNDLGGESITALTILRNLFEQMGVVLDVSMMKVYPTISSISSYIDSLADSVARAA